MKDRDSEISFEEQVETEDFPVLKEVEQFVGDNIDLAIRSQYGNTAFTAFHAMGRMKIISPAPTDVIESIIERQRLKPDEKATLLNDLTIRFYPYSLLPPQRKWSKHCHIQARPFDKLQRKFVYDTL